LCDLEHDLSVDAQLALYQLVDRLIHSAFRRVLDWNDAETDGRRAHGLENSGDSRALSVVRARAEDLAGSHVRPRANQTEECDGCSASFGPIGGTIRRHLSAYPFDDGAHHRRGVHARVILSAEALDRTFGHRC
jgi:hypothetical protein